MAYKEGSQNPSEKTPGQVASAKPDENYFAAKYDWVGRGSEQVKFAIQFLLL